MVEVKGKGSSIRKGAASMVKGLWVKGQGLRVKGKWVEGSGSRVDG